MGCWLARAIPLFWALQAINDADPGPAELSGSDLILLHLFKVLEGYMRCLPGMCVEARFNAWQLLPQVGTAKFLVRMPERLLDRCTLFICAPNALLLVYVLYKGCCIKLKPVQDASMHPSLQHAVLSVLQASLESTQGAAAGALQATAEQLASLLQLLQHKPAGSAVHELAYGAAQSYLQQTIGFDNLAEVHLWLDSLPRMSTTEDSARCALHCTTLWYYSLQS